MAYVKTNVPGLLKDPATGVIINKNIKEYEALKAKRKQAREQADLVQTVGQLQNDMTEIKALLRKLLGE